MELNPNARQINPVHKPLRFLKNNRNIILPFKPESSKWFFPFGFSTEPLYAFSFFNIRATFPAQIIFYDFLTRLIFGKKFK
jgi:hypothetical protein